jgi:hypothetical protein
MVWVEVIPSGLPQVLIPTVYVPTGSAGRVQVIWVLDTTLQLVGLMVVGVAVLIATSYVPAKLLPLMVSKSPPFSPAVRDPPGLLVEIDVIAAELIGLADTEALREAK